MSEPTSRTPTEEKFKSLESMEGVLDGPPQIHRDWRSKFLDLYPGTVTASTIALASAWLAQHYGAPVMLFALLLGMAFHFLHDQQRCFAGIEFCSREILRIGVALLGLRITANQMAGLGIVPIVVVLVGVASTILLGVWAGHRMGLGKYFGALSGGAVAICGASAALAISTALPSYPNRERDTILTVVGVTTLSTIAMILYPLVVTLFGLDNIRAGLFLGGTIHDVAQVVGSGYMISQEAGDVATYVKLMRVATLIPVVLFIALVLVGRAGLTKRRGRRFPLFLVGFAALVIINSALPVPEIVTDAATTISRWCLVTAIAALGMKTSLQQLAVVGWRPVALIVFETIWIAALVLASIKMS